MPAYNAERTVLESVSSVLSQTHRALELIVCDDASSDDTLTMLESVSDPRLRILMNDRNLGQGPSRDRAIAVANYPWIAFIDADDAWSKNRLEEMLFALHDDDDAMVFDDLMTCHDTPRGLLAWKRLRGEHAFGQDISTSRYISVSDYLLADRLLIKPIVPVAPIRANNITHSRREFGEDTEFFLRLASHGVRMIYVPEPLYHYRITPGSLTASSGNVSAMRDCLEECAAFPGFSTSEAAAFAKKIDRLRDNEVIHSAAMMITQGRLLDALRMLFKRPSALKQFPTRAFLRLGYEAHRLMNGGRAR